MTGQKILKQYFGYDEYRDGQEKIISEITDGRDALCIMPTGAGKSLCYQIPALMMEGITIVISPLVSLMKDQVTHLIGNGIKAAYINSSLTVGQINTAMKRAKGGWYKIIYVAPERLLLPSFLDFAVNANISMVTIDEAHCVSQWGHDFRASYLDIPDFVERLPNRPELSAFTATATKAVKNDILKLLKLRNPFQITTGFDRENLYFSVESPRDKTQFLISFLREHKESSSIVYCSTRKNVEEVCMSLKGAGFSATRYHAGLSQQERHGNQEDFVFERSKIIVATNAFGMGIDKSNVRNVVHYNMPKNLEAYYQEAGRAGRDGLKASCILLYSPADIVTNRYLINNSDDGETEPQIIEKNLKLLNVMAGYCTANGCLRKYILRYFGEELEKPCGNCGNCSMEYDLQDITGSARQIFSCINFFAKRRRRFGKMLIASVLSGSRSKRVLDLNLTDNPMYGELGALPQQEIVDILENLIESGYLEVDGGEYPTVSVTDMAGTADEIFIKVPKRPVMHGDKEIDRAILYCVKNLKSMDVTLGRTMIAAVLTGSQNKRIFELGIDEIQEYGMLTCSQKDVIKHIQELIDRECLESSGGMYPTVSLTSSGIREMADKPAVPQLRQTLDGDVQEESGLMECLHGLCQRISTEEKIPVYQVFSEVTLQDICRKTPKTLEEFSQVSGVGRTKLDKYGERFLAVIRGVSYL